MTSSARYILASAILVTVMLAEIATLNIRRDSSGLLAAVGLSDPVPSGGDDAWLGSAGGFPVPGGSREAKVFNAVLYKPQVAMLGSSTVYNVVNANRLPELQQADGRYGYNFGIAGLSISEMELAFEHLLALGSLQKAVIGLELFMFSGHDFHVNDLARLPLAHRRDYLYRLWTYLAPRIVSIDTTAANLAHVLQPLSTFISATARASQRQESAGSPRLEAGGASISRVVRDRLHENDRAQIKYLYIARAPFTFGNNVFDALQRIISQARRKGVEVRFYVSPHHARAYETIRALGLWTAYTAWLRKLTLLVDQVNAGRPCNDRIAILNFGAYKPQNIDYSMSAGPSAGAFADYFDSYHFKERVAEQIFKTVMGLDPCGELPDEAVATSLRGETIEEHLQKIETERESFARAHADEVADVEAVVKSVPGHEVLLQQK